MLKDFKSYNESIIDTMEQMKVKIKDLFDKSFIADIRMRSISFLNDKQGRLVNIPIYSLDIKKFEYTKKQILYLLDDIKSELKESLNLEFYKIIMYHDCVDIWLCKYAEYAMKNKGKLHHTCINPGFEVYGKEVLLNKSFLDGI